MRCTGPGAYCGRLRAPSVLRIGSPEAKCSSRPPDSLRAGSLDQLAFRSVPLRARLSALTKTLSRRSVVELQYNCRKPGAISKHHKRSGMRYNPGANRPGARRHSQDLAATGAL